MMSGQFKSTFTDLLSGLLRNKIWCLVALVAFSLGSCSEKQDGPVLFDALTFRETGLDFANKLTPTDSFNLFDYMYYYNGSGIAAGDFNNDGLVDVFFGANQSANKIYLNQGGMKFRNVSVEAQIPGDKGWTTGISVVDINHDGLLDIYICYVSNHKHLTGKNQLLVCQDIGDDGVPVYKDQAADYGLDYSGFSTQAAFFDMDMDGDLDMFLLNHSVHESAVYRPRQNFLGQVHPVAGSRLYRNDGRRFTDVTASTGINSSLIGYGLGICVADINMDGFPDVYIGNDFHENDYMYINDGHGNFREENTQRTGHTSRFTMGVDIADINNDGLNEIVAMDMLSDDPYTLKRSLGEDEYDIFNLKIGYGYQPQYTRNTLQFNRGNNHYTEVGLYSGIAATDWSWSPLFIDFDNDGLKDLFISNGIPKRMNDIDYINFVSNEEIQRRLQPGAHSRNNLEMIEKFPNIRIRNKFFQNTGSMRFRDLKDSIGNPPSTYSNGAVYADFDNDGDPDIIVNNTDENATLYRNNTVSTGDSLSIREPANNFIDIKLQGDSLNVHALGARLIVYSGTQRIVSEKHTLHGFLSSGEKPLHVGLGTLKIDSIVLIWPDNHYENISTDSINKRITIKYRRNLPVFAYPKQPYVRSSSGVLVTDVTTAAGLRFNHIEDKFHEFNRDPLIPHMLSTEGPALAVDDIDGDGLDDLFIGSARGGQSGVWIQNKNGTFSKSEQPALVTDSAYEDVSACWADLDNDGKKDLIIASGGNEYSGQSAMLLPRVYLMKNNLLTRKSDAIQGIHMTAGVVTAADFNKDGFADIFIGGRAVPLEYGKPPRSYLLLNDGSGKFSNITNTHCNGLSEVGFVTSASWLDIDRDNDQDLLVSLEWGGIRLFVNVSGKLEPKDITDKMGWWNFVKAVDIDNDGDPDLVAGNLGLNSRLHGSKSEPVRMYYGDFDDNGKGEQILTYYIQHKEVPFASIAELSKQMPLIKKKFLYASDFAKASIAEVFGVNKIKSSKLYTADYFGNAIFINNGNYEFEFRELPWQAQLSSYRDATIIDANGDSLPDIFLAGNYFDSNTEMGRYDGDYGTVLVNNGKGNFDVSLIEGAVLRGQARHLSTFRTVSGQQKIVIVNNNDSARVLQIAPFLRRPD